MITGTNNRDLSTQNDAKYPFREYWRAKILKLNILDADPILDLLAISFPSIENHAQNPGTWLYREMPVYDTGYFDRYFRNILSKDEITQAQYLAYIEDINQSEFCDDSNRVRKDIITGNRDVASKLVLNKNFPKILAEKLYLEISQIDSFRSTFGSMSMRNNPCGNVLFKAAIEKHYESYQSLDSLAKIIQYNYPDNIYPYLSQFLIQKFTPDSNDPLDSIDDDRRKLIVQEFENKLRSLFMQDPHEADLSLLSGLAVLANLKSMEYAKNYLTQEIVNSSSWTTLDVLPIFISIVPFQKSSPEGKWKFSVSVFLSLANSYLGINAEKFSTRAQENSNNAVDIEVSFIPANHQQALQFIRTYIPFKE